MNPQTNSAQGPGSSATDERHALRDAFICYAPVDRSRADEIRSHLEGLGLSCWIAPRDLPEGEDPGAASARAIDTCRCLVLVLSAASNESVMVRQHVQRAATVGRPTFPVRIEDVPPSRALEIYVSAAHWVDAWQGAMAEHMRKLADGLSDDRSHDEIRMVMGRKRRARRLRVSASTLGALVIALLAVAAVVRTSASATRPDPVVATLKQYGIDASSVRAEDFNVRVSIDDGFPKIMVTSASPDRDIVGMSWTRVRVGQRPWTMLTDSIDGLAKIHLLTDADIDARGPVQLQLYANDADDSPTYGPYTFDIDVSEAIQTARNAGFEALKLRAENARWLTNPDYWGVDHAAATELADVIDAFEFGPSETDLSHTVVVHDGSSFGRTSVGRPADAWRLVSDLAMALNESLSGKTVFVRLRYIDGTVGTTQRYGK